MSKNDDKILELKKQIEAKKASLGPIKRFAPLTSCSLELNGTRYNLHATDRPTLILLFCQLHSICLAASDLGYEDECIISGFPIKEWGADIQAKLEIMDQKQDLEKLKSMEAQLNKLLSDDKKTEMEIDAIANMLDL